MQEMQETAVLYSACEKQWGCNLDYRKAYYKTAFKTGSMTQ